MKRTHARGYPVSPPSENRTTVGSSRTGAWWIKRAQSTAQIGKKSAFAHERQPPGQPHRVGMHSETVTVPKAGIIYEFSETIPRKCKHLVHDVCFRRSDGFGSSSRHSTKEETLQAARGEKRDTICLRSSLQSICIAFFYCPICSHGRYLGVRDLSPCQRAAVRAGEDLLHRHCCSRITCVASFPEAVVIARGGEDEKSHPEGAPW